VLLGGDLFHENKPKPATFQRTVDILQKHCLGPRCVT
jgi:DNA repair exonuclease SbcCD nuclease subunit